MSGVLRSEPTTKRNYTVRISEPSQHKKAVKIINHNRHSTDQSTNNDNDCIPITSHRANLQGTAKYSIPELNSALVLAKRLDQLKTSKAKKITNFNELTPRTKTIATEKVLKKLNFQSDKTVYKHLVPINVNDSVLDIKLTNRKSKHDFALAKDPEPVLSHYLKPMVLLEHRLTLDSDSDEDEKRYRVPTDHYQHMYQFYEQYLCPTGSKSIHQSK